MKSIQKIPLVIGNEVLFIEEGIPHTGMIKDIYGNMLILDHVTFVDPIFDKRSRKPSHEETWEVRPDEVIKTSEYYLPVHPNYETIIYINQIINSTANDVELTSTTISQFTKLYKEKYIYSKQSSLFFPFPDNYIQFNENMIITMDNFAGSLFIPLITRTLGRTYYALERYTVDSLTEPTMIILPYWKDEARGRSGNLNDTEDRIKIDYLERHKELGVDANIPSIVYMQEVNEDWIDKIFYVTDRTLQYYFKEKPVTTSLFYKDDNTSKISFQHIYTSVCYKKKRERS